MAKKKPAAPGDLSRGKQVIRHARVELPDEQYRLVQSVAEFKGLTLAGYIRQAILDRALEDRAKMEDAKKFLP